MPTDDQNTQMTQNSMPAQPMASTPAADMPGSALNVPADTAPVAGATTGTSDASMGMGTAPAATAPVEPVVPQETAPVANAPMDTTNTTVPGAMPAADGNQPAQ